MDRIELIRVAERWYELNHADGEAVAAELLLFVKGSNRVRNACEIQREVAAERFRASLRS
jgi:hypothetical protein